MQIKSDIIENEQFIKCSICDGRIFLLHSDLNVAYYRCMRCGILHHRFLSLTDLPEASTLDKPLNSQISSGLYEEDYFIADYEKQYGRSYVEDAPAIRGMARNRLQRLQQMYTLDQWENRHHLSICDIGCALGFFLDEVRRGGFGQASGVEISRYAAHFCETHLHLPVENLGLMQWESKQKFDVITMFYVLEHFAAQKEILQKIHKALVPEGKLVLALPSTWGPHYIWQKKNWFLSHPKDHHVDYDPLSIRLVLKHFGFSVEAIYPGAAHFERFPFPILWDNPFSRLFSWKKTVDSLRVYAEFGDTMEVYARRMD